MSPLETKIRALFDAYGQHADKALRDPPPEDSDGLSNVFAAFVVESSPSGVSGGGHEHHVRAQLPRGFARYRAAGGRHLTIKGLRIIELDRLHAVADVDWDFVYANQAGRSGHLTFTNFYLITIADGSPKIFAAVAPDEHQALAAHGLV